MDSSTTSWATNLSEPEIFPAFAPSERRAGLLHFRLLRLRHEVSAPRLNLHAFAIHLHFEAMIGAVCLHAIERKLEHVDDFRCLRDALESCVQVIAIVKEPTAGAVGEFSHRSEEHTSELQSLRHLVC